MAPHSSTLAWKIPCMEEPGWLQSMGSRRVGHDWATSLSRFIFMHWRRKWQPLQCSCLENPRDRGAWLAAVYGVAQSRTQLKRLSSSRVAVKRKIISGSWWFQITESTCKCDFQNKTVGMFQNQTVVRKNYSVWVLFLENYFPGYKWRLLRKFQGTRKDTEKERRK